MTIKELRTSLKLSQAAFAKELGMTAGAISSMENGRTGISPRTIAKIKRIFGADVEHGTVKTKKAADVSPARPSVPAAASSPSGSSASALPFTLYIQSPYGGDITPEQIAARMPEGIDKAYVRVDQNLIWWVRGDETGAVTIWND